MTTDGPLDQRAASRRPAIGAAVVLGTGGVVAAIVVCFVVLVAPSPRVLSDQQFAALKLGQARSDVEHAVGPPKKDAKLVQPASLLPGMTCTYYDGTSPSSIPSYVRLCYTNDVLSSKIEYSSVYGQSDQPSVAPSPS